MTPEAQYVSYDYKYMIKIWPDSYTESPRTSTDCNSTAMVFHSKCKVSSDKFDYYDNDLANALDKYEDLESIMKYVKRETKALAIQPVFLYDHSGLSLDTYRRCRWDSGQIGFCVVTSKTLKHWSIASRRKYLKENGSYDKLITEELETYSKWLNGECYWYEVFELNRNLPTMRLPGLFEPTVDILSSTDEEDATYEYELNDSCGGFIGMEDCLEYIYDVLDLKATDFQEDSTFKEDEITNIIKEQLAA